MFDTDGDKIYSITIQIPDGLVAFKFFLGTGWGVLATLLQEQDLIQETGHLNFRKLSV